MPHRRSASFNGISPFSPGLCDFVVLWPAESTVCIFHIATEAQYDRLLKNQFDNLEQ